jgi:hypothetical protein
MTRLAEIGPRLKKLLLMLSSEQPGEVINAARLIGTTLRGVGADWHDLTAGLLTPATAPHSARWSAGETWDEDDLDWHAMREFCLQHPELLRSREREFMDSIGDWRGQLTEKQFAWLNSIHARVRRATA